MGGEGIRVTKPEEVGPALTSLINSGKPGVLEIVVSQVDILLLLLGSTTLKTLKLF